MDKKKKLKFFENKILKKEVIFMFENLLYDLLARFENFKRCPKDGTNLEIANPAYKCPICVLLLHIEKIRDIKRYFDPNNEIDHLDVLDAVNDLVKSLDTVKSLLKKDYKEMVKNYNYSFKS